MTKKIRSKSASPRPAAGAPRKQRLADPVVDETAPTRVDNAPVATATMAKPAHLCVVGIGASAGGFEATSTVLARLPPDCNFCVVVIQHLDPKQPSRAAELLARAGVARLRAGGRVRACERIRLRGRKLCERAHACLHGLL